MNDAQKIAAMRRELQNRRLDGMVLPVTDEYQGEYCADYAKRVTWLCGFDGSAGTVVVLHDHAALFVDGRYTIQAAQEVDTSIYTVYNSADVSISEYVADHVAGDACIAYDPWLHTVAVIDRWNVSFPCSIEPLKDNVIDVIWSDQPLRPDAAVTEHKLQYAGCSREEKIAQTIDMMKGDALLLTEPDAICWLLNIRGADIPYNPLPLCYCVLKENGQIFLMIQKDKVSDGLFDHSVHIVDESTLPQWYAAQSFGSMQIDPATCPVWFAQALEQSDTTIIYEKNPVTLLKAIKNDTEIAGIRRAHEIDGRAVTAFSEWFAALSDTEEITELDMIEKLEACRRESDEYLQPSFATIAGAGEHGAIVHYRASDKTNRELAMNECLLVDSGGQYRFGTTDVTRIYMRGTPSESFKRYYTLVLKGHIALAEAVFPEGTTGHQLDVLARQFLWQDGLDYQHGTGHGVGHYLCVHEGPQNISKRASYVPLQPGMILSNEPGFYKEGAYGIRIESLILVVEKYVVDDVRYFAFETLTRVPIDESLVDRDLMSGDEWRWLQHYNKQVKQAS